MKNVKLIDETAIYYGINDTELTKELLEETHMKPSVLLKNVKLLMDEVDRLTAEMNELAELCSHYNIIAYIEAMAIRSRRVAEIEKELIEYHDLLTDMGIDPKNYKDPYLIIDELYNKLEVKDDEVTRLKMEMAITDISRYFNS